MFLIVGLGNPEPKYFKTRHNIGFLAVDEIAHTLQASWKKKAEVSAEVAETHVDQMKVILAKPQTYMNLSGKAVAALLYRFHIEAHHVIVISDDVTLPVGTIRIRKEGSAGGHNGLKSIINSIGTQQFTRIRIGVGAQPPQIPLEDWVLQKLPPADEKNIPLILEKTYEASLSLLHGKMPPQTIHALKNSPEA
ncbi:aminoacyl-tRNA hydrolase [bacterium]|nr:aminoacyl-tRNA hydrolase [bacterium]NBX50009.1 aminoacyl-tRNA hydrolase [bacterium]